MKDNVNYSKGEWKLTLTVIFYDILYNYRKNVKIEERDFLETSVLEKALLTP